MKSSFRNRKKIISTWDTVKIKLVNCEFSVLEMGLVELLRKVKIQGGFFFIAGTAQSMNQPIIITI